MSIGYKDMTIADFNNYFAGGYAFLYGKGEAYAPYRVGSCELYYEEHDRYDRDISETSIEMRRVTPDGEEPAYVVEHTVRNLFDKPEWIMHRFRVGYVAINGRFLIRLGLEPEERRMFKGTSFSYTKFHGILDARLNAVPSRIASTVAFAQSSTHPSYQSLVLAGVESDPVHSADIAIGIAKVLSYGHMHCTRRMISPSEARSRSTRAVLRLLSEDSPDIALALSDSVALVRHRHQKSKAYMLVNGGYAGVIKNVGGELQATLTVGRLANKKARTLSRAGLGAMTTRMLTAEVAWA